MPCQKVRQLPKWQQRRHSPPVDLASIGGNQNCQMRYEPGTSECRVLINSKEQIEAMLLSLSRLENTEAIRSQLKAVHSQLETLHDQVRESRSAARA